MGAEYSIEHSIEPATESVIEPVIEPATEPVIKPVIEPVIRHSTHIKHSKRQLTRDEGIQILAFRWLGMTYEAIAKQFRNVSSYQVERIVHKDHPTPKKRPSQSLFI